MERRLCFFFFEVSVKGLPRIWHYTMNKGAGSGGVIPCSQGITQQNDIRSGLLSIE
jgi:hypothetical protein